MTEITLGYSKEIIEVSVVGHSGYAERGKDIVCSAVSALSTSFVLALQNLEQKGTLIIESLRMTDGELYVAYRDTFSVTASMRIMLMEGLSAIEDQYPDYVKVSYA